MLDDVDFKLKSPRHHRSREAVIDQEANLKLELWRAGDARYRYLEHRCSDLANKSSRELFASNRLDLLGRDIISVLKAYAEEVAKRCIRQRNTLHHIHSTTPQEKCILSAINHILIKYLSSKHGRIIYPRTVGKAKRQIALFVPDVLIVGVRPLQGKAKSLNSSKLVNKEWLAICVEVDGDIHDDPAKVKADLAQAECLAELGVFTIRINNSDIDVRTGHISQSALQQVSGLVIAGTRYPRAESLAKLELRMDLRTIATVLSLADADRILQQKFGHNFDLESGFRLVAEIKNNKHFPLKLRHDLERRKTALDFVTRAQVKMQLSRECLPADLLDSDAI